MPYQTVESDGLVVESEHKQTTLRVFQNGERVFSCEVTTASPTQARVTNGNGRLNPKLFRTVESWLREQGFKTYTYEREGKSERRFHLVKS